MWDSVGFQMEYPIMFITGYKAHNEPKTHYDNFFYEWLSDRYMAGGLGSVEEKHKTWRFGVPKITSAFRDVKRYRCELTPPEPVVWAQSQEWCARHFACMGDSRIIWDLDFIQTQLNLKTSPGFPYNRKYKGKPAFSSKRALFSFEEGRFSKIEFADYLNRISSRDYKSSEFYTLTAKKELRKIKKIESDAFRGYLAASWRNTCAGVGACGEMCEKFYRSWDTTAAFVGGSTFHGCWNKLFTRLNKHPNAFECDESSYDSTLSAAMIDSLADVMWNFVASSDKTELNRVRWTNIFKEISHSIVICPNGDLFFKTQGNPSGSFLTIVTNTLILYMLFCYAWLVLAPPEFATYEMFCKHVELALCGDDNLGTTSDEVKNWFNVETIVGVWSNLGIVAKQEAKSSGPLIERQFLSQHTRLIAGIFVPYPDYDKSVSSMLWHTRAHHHVRWSFLKAAALRLSTFWHPKSKELFEGYLAYLLQRFNSELRSPRNPANVHDMFTWEQVFSVYKTDEAIIHLFITNESARVNNLARLNDNNFCYHAWKEVSTDYEAQGRWVTEEETSLCDTPI
jgi:hypothetical protein